MVTIDTNVLVRILIDDGSTTQIQAARKLAQRAKHLFIPSIVQAELVWVLMRAYKLTKKEVLTVLHELQDNAAFIMDSEEQYANALEQYSHHGVDFADCLIQAAALENDSMPIYTFDRKFTRLDHVRHLR